jgi:uncharacterized protein (TIGR00730 family)
VKYVCVFCGSSAGDDPVFAEAAVSLGASMVERGYGLVYGGASVGLMGTVADTVLQRGGDVVGVIPAALAAKEIAHQGLTELLVVDSMHARKAAMAERADAFVALPGGMGTLEEVFEVLTWAQLGIHAKPCGLLDVGGYFDALLHFLDNAVSHRFLRPQHREMLIVASQADDLLDRFERYRPVEVRKWLDATRT